MKQARQLDPPVKVLAIDDEESIRELLRAYLTSQECDVDVAENGRQGLERLLDEAYDVAVVDLKMRHMDGFAFLTEALKVRPWLGVVIITGYADDATRYQAEKLGVRHILMKPINLQDLSARVLEEAVRSREESGRVSSALEQFQCELSILKKLTRSAIETDSLPEALHNLSESFADVLPASAVGMLTVEKDGPEILIFLRESASGEFVQEMEHQMRYRFEALSNQALPEKITLQLDGAACDADGVPRLGTCFTVPIISAGEVLGVLSLGSGDPVAYPAEITAFLYHAANSLSSVLIAFRDTQELAIRDGLTGLYNRRHMLEQLEYIRRMCKRYDFPVGVAIVDVDHFKQINDTYGHLAGDEVLVELADLLRSTVAREADVVGRYGGDEMVVILPNSTLEGAWSFGSRLLEVIRPRLFCEGRHNVDVRVSIGVTSIPGDQTMETTCEGLLSHADQALYTAKRKGRDCMCAWSDGVDVVLDGTVVAERRSGHVGSPCLTIESQTIRQTVMSVLCSVMDVEREAVGEHSNTAREMALILGKRIGVSDRELQDLADGAVLHDIGKIAIPANILSKKGKLSAEEWRILRRHPRLGYEILKRYECLANVPQIVLHHHERYDGDGYPDRLKGDAIPLAARIVAVLDAYEAMRSDRVYRGRMPRDQAVQVIKDGAGTQFDPNVVGEFLKAVDDFEAVGRWDEAADTLVQDPP